jgi:hypothetical protein
LGDSIVREKQGESDILTAWRYDRAKIGAGVVEAASLRCQTSGPGDKASPGLLR